MNDLDPGANYEAIILRAKAMRAEATADLLNRFFNLFRRKKAALPVQA
ncbi:hypothetical protein [Tabrizicola sp.]|nr:hypothetical protein [Tabrizicola sp.]MDM7932425.1 hypothetical protein [Tabrizicola sp.]